MGENHSIPCSSVLDLYKRVDNMEVLIREIDRRTIIDGTILENVVSALNRNTEVIEKVDDSLIIMNGTMTRQEDKIVTLQGEVSKINKKFEVTDDYFKIDTRKIFNKFLYDNGKYFIVPGGILILILSIVKLIAEYGDTLQKIFSN